MKKQTLLIGINNYPILPRLNYARQDAEAVAHSLKQNYCFSDDEIMLLTDAKPGLFKPINRRVIEKHLENLADQELDLFIFGFWGHGLFRNGQRYFCPLDAIGDDIENLGLSFDALQRLLSNIKAKNTCMILDCCQSIHDRGDSETFTAAEQVLMENSARDIVFHRKERDPGFHSNVAILNSCKEGQSAYEWDTRQHGLFTAYLLDAMNNRCSSVMDIASYISNNIENTALEMGREQMPFFKMEGNIRLPVDTRPAQPEPVQPKAKPSSTLMHVTVPEDFTTIAEAYNNVQDNGVITIQPGKYELPSTIAVNRSVTFRGSSGRAKDVIIDCPFENTFEITGGNPSFQNVTVICEADKSSCFSITGGKPKFFRCVIVSHKGNGIGIKGENANSQVESCTIKECGAYGVSVSDKALGSFVNCDIYANAYAEIHVETSGNPNCTGCKIHDGKQCGVWIRNNGRGSFNNCDIYGNAYAGICVETSGNPTCTGCKIHDGKQNGAWVKDNGLGSFNNCDIYGNAYPGICVVTSGNPIFTGCKIHDGKQNGAWVKDNGLGSFINCDIYANAYAGIHVETSGNPTVTGCNIHDGKGGGVYIEKKGSGTFINNTLSNYDDEGYGDNWTIRFSASRVKGSGNSPSLPFQWFKWW